uniref:Ectonucleotide pyrophosphatase/phosphodiesterase 1 n=1 Tax=Astyanax mexicanus TaxID=7994 RepID=A0A8B9LLW0_ASTMX
LLLSLLAIILAVVLTLKLHCDVKVNSCKSRCLSGKRTIDATCHCDPACVKEGNCCLDYKEICVEPSQRWTCSIYRCGEDRLPNSLCSCAADCSQKGDCCANYNNVCEGEKSWLEEDCEDIKTPQCPAGQLYSDALLVQITFLIFSQGLYPETHGIVDNKMYDVIHNASFSLKSDEKFNSFWYLGEPVWITAMKNNLKAGTFFWPGSDVDIQGQFPDFYQKYDMRIPFEKRVKAVFDWLNLPQHKRPDFYTLYMDEPDSSGHRYGPMSSQVIEALIKVDRIISLVMEGLKQRKLHNCVNLILLSDHGMEEASCKKAAYVSTYQKNIDDFIVIQGPAARIRPKQIPEDFFTFNYEGVVKNLSCRAPDQPMKPYLKEHLPKRLHFANSVRIERAHLYMKAQWQAALQPNQIKYCNGGFHGSDNAFRNMQAIFIGYGPGMKYNTTVAPFENIEVYNLICDLLGVQPAPNNGTHGSLNHLLRIPTYQPVYPAEISPASSCSAPTLSPTDQQGCVCSSITPDQVNNHTKTQQNLHKISSLLSSTDNLKLYDSLITSNMAPMFPIFKGIWDYFHNVLLVKYSQERNGLNVMTGPIFDKDYNGNYDIMAGKTLSTEAPTPTHFYVILTSCKNASVALQQCDGPLDVLSLILPHRADNLETCHKGNDYSWVEEWTQHHVARVRDIELLTGLSFYHDRLSVTETLQLKTFLPTF